MIPARKLEPKPETTAKAAPRVRSASPIDQGARSPAAELQAQLESEFQADIDSRRLPLRVSLPIVSAASAALWWGIVAGLSRLLGN